VSNGTDSGIEDEVFHQPDTDVVRSQARSCTDHPLRRGHCAATLVTRLPTISAALCAGARRLESLSVTGFPSASVPGWHSSRLPTDYVGMADVSRLPVALDPVRGVSGWAGGSVPDGSRA
jgi:hypothetical protein